MTKKKNEPEKRARGSKYTHKEIDEQNKRVMKRYKDTLNLKQACKDEEMPYLTMWDRVRKSPELQTKMRLSVWEITVTAEKAVAKQIRYEAEHAGKDGADVSNSWKWLEKRQPEYKWDKDETNNKRQPLTAEEVQKVEKMEEI